jgi:hypothetical protein
MNASGMNCAAYQGSPVRTTEPYTAHRLQGDSLGIRRRLAATMQPAIRMT